VAATTVGWSQAGDARDVSQPFHFDVTTKQVSRWIQTVRKKLALIHGIKTITRVTNELVF
jgi:hypothetical protein